MPKIIEPDGFEDPNKIEPINIITDDSWYEKRLVPDMKKNGWRGRPLLVTRHKRRLYALTGSHRIHAARECGIQVPVVYYKDWNEFPVSCISAVQKYKFAAANKNPVPDPSYPEKVWWLFRMEGQQYRRNSNSRRT